MHLCPLHGRATEDTTAGLQGYFEVLEAARLVRGEGGISEGRGRIGVGRRGGADEEGRGWSEGRNTPIGVEEECLMPHYAHTHTRTHAHTHTHVPLCIPPTLYRSCQ